jgi:flagellin-like protein
MRNISLKRNKKGVSPIIATLLLIVIAVAAAVVTYAFVTGFIGTATSQSNQQGAMAIDTGTITDGTHLTVYVRNTGTKSEILGAAYVNNTLIPATSVWINSVVNTPYTLGPGAVVNVTCVGTVNWADGNSYTVRIVASDGTPVAYSLHA